MLHDLLYVSYGMGASSQFDLLLFLFLFSILNLLVVSYAT